MNQFYVIRVILIDFFADILELQPHVKNWGNKSQETWEIIL